MLDEKTTHKGYPLPHRENQLSEDVERLREAIIGIDKEIHSIEESIKSLITEVGAVSTYVDSGLDILRTDDADLFAVVGDVRDMLKEGDRVKINGKVATITSVEYADDDAETSCTLDTGILENGDVSHKIAVCREYVTIPEVPSATTEKYGLVKLAPIPVEEIEMLPE